MPRRNRNKTVDYEYLGRLKEDKRLDTEQSAAAGSGSAKPDKEDKPKEKGGCK